MFNWDSTARIKKAEFPPRVTGKGKRWVSAVSVLFNVQMSQSLAQPKRVCGSESRASVSVGAQ